MKITVVTAFPAFFHSFLSTSILGRAVKAGLLEVQVVDLRDYGQGSYRQIDDYSFGGRGGMTLMAEPLQQALDAVVSPGAKVLYPTPQGVVLTQDLVEALATEDHLVILCGHYEGVDERLIQQRVDLELSIGDYVLTGGELPTMVLIDALARLIPGVVGKELSVRDDSFYNAMLDTPHYSRPALWQGLAVPEVLLSGHDKRIEHWRRRTAAARTLSRRPDLLSRANAVAYLEDRAYLALVVDPADEDLPELMTAAAATAKAYGLARTLAIPRLRQDLEELRQQLSQLDCAAKAFPTLGAMVKWVESRGTKATVVAAQVPGGIPWLEAKRRILEAQGPVVILFGGSVAGGVNMRPQETIGGELPRTALVSAVLDRFFGSR